ncbi:MAG: transposase [Armatimonadetes bacterium]|nr:transposase [Armatimonadota bacterium]
MTTRRSYTPAFKARVVLEMFKEEKSLSQLASEYGLCPSVLSRWRTAAIDGLPTLFLDDNQGRAAERAAHERQLQELYAEIGRLTTQLGWLKRKAGIEHVSS